MAENDRVRLLPLVALVLVSACSPTANDTCSIANCGGCCDTNGQCQTGTSDTACGSAALNCNVCSGGQICAGQRCVFQTVAPVDAGVPDAGMPILAPVETWTWAGFPDSACGNGVPTGVGVNATNRSKDVFLFLMGGGACWNSLTCAFAAQGISSGYGPADFTNETVRQAPMFDRANASNPFKDMSFVFVPYCTGDVHIGDNVMAYPALGAQVPARTVHHKGGKNLEAFLVRLKDTFPDAQRVFLTGSSAGAFGAQFNYARVAATWPSAEVHVLADCGQIINPAGSLLTEWRTSWNFAIPTDCVGCDADFAKFPKYLHDKHPSSRFSLYAYTQDNTLRQFSGYDAATYKTNTLALMASGYDTTSNAKYFVLDQANHVMIGDLLTLVGPGNVSLLSWTTAFVKGEPGWVNVK